MAETCKVLEGVFAISKPPSLSSAQVIRDIQQHFAKSATFAPLLTATNKALENEDRRYGKRRRRDPDSVFKIGHGGTLDPLATGVLIIGIGRGTKHLQNFLGCTKQYDTVVLFGKSTDTYDVMGKIVGQAPYDQISKDKVEAKLGMFRGHIKQVPPVYSALKINGMKAYEYARSGKELPRQLESRDMEVSQCELIEYLEGGQHDFRWPIQEAAEDEKQAVQRLMKSAETTSELHQQPQSSETKESRVENPSEGTGELTTTKKSDNTLQAIATETADEAITSTDVTTERPKGEADPEIKTETIKPATESQVASHTDQSSATANSSTQQPASEVSPKQDANKVNQLNPKDNTLAPEIKAALHTHDMPSLSANPAPSPAARVSLRVSSGFYVRSFAHDLGIALGSHGIMAELIRSRQGDFVIPELAAQFPDLVPALTYDQLNSGEETWGPLISKTLEAWMSKNPLPGQPDVDGNIRPDDRDRNRKNRDYGRRYGKGHGWKGKNDSRWRGGVKRDRD